MLKRILLSSVIAVLPFAAAYANTSVAPLPGFFYSSAGCDYLWLPGFGWGSFRAGTMVSGAPEEENVEKVLEWSEVIQSIEMFNASLPAANQRVVQVVNYGQDANYCGNYTIITALVL